mmetsp:Transcript_126859/g.358969  ORF Transcript_126859/g.358969 Transcript_126859/m.358969 type:complete len:206 (-) Transcript_126859:689-1306(-)
MSTSTSSVSSTSLPRYFCTSRHTDRRRVLPSGANRLKQEAAPMSDVSGSRAFQNSQTMSPPRAKLSLKYIRRSWPSSSGLTLLPTVPLSHRDSEKYPALRPSCAQSRVPSTSPLATLSSYSGMSFRPMAALSWADTCCQPMSLRSFLALSTITISWRSCSSTHAGRSSPELRSNTASSMSASPLSMAAPPPLLLAAPTSLCRTSA